MCTALCRCLNSGTGGPLAWQEDQVRHKPPLGSNPSSEENLPQGNGFLDPKAATYALWVVPNMLHHIVFYACVPRCCLNVFGPGMLIFFEFPLSPPRSTWTRSHGSPIPFATVWPESAWSSAFIRSWLSSISTSSLFYISSLTGMWGSSRIPRVLLSQWLGQNLGIRLLLQLIVARPMFLFPSL